MFKFSMFEQKLIFRFWFKNNQRPIDTRPFINFNSFDDINGLDRRSCLGDYAVLDCLPLNPLGRTGIAGRGSLPYWGPNQVYEIAFTRFKRNSSGEIIVEDGKRQVEFIIVKNKNDEWSFPTVCVHKFYSPEVLIVLYCDIFLF